MSVLPAGGRDYEDNDCVMIVSIFALMMVIVCKHCKNDDDGNDDLDASNNGNLLTKEVSKFCVT